VTDLDFRRYRVCLLASLLKIAVRLLYASLRVTVKGEEEMERLIEKHGGVLLVTWHGNSLIPIARSVGKDYYGLVSLSRDGDLLSEFMHQMQWRTIRGSTGRRGAKAVRQALEILNQPGTVLAVTPDGPRGPACQVQPGVVYLAQKSGKPIIPVGIGIRHAWHARSWDRFQIPLPFSQVYWKWGEPIFIAGGEEDLPGVQQLVEKAILAVEREAMQAVYTAPHTGSKRSSLTLVEDVFKEGPHG
jgi:hypothetical protein